MNGKLIEEAIESFDNIVKENTSMIIYIKEGFQEPTYVVKVEKIFEDVYPFSLFNAGCISISAIKEMIKDFQQIAKEKGVPVLFASSSDSFRTYLLDNGIENVISITKDNEKIILKFIRDKTQR